MLFYYLKKNANAEVTAVRKALLHLHTQDLRGFVCPRVKSVVRRGCFFPHITIPNCIDSYIKKG